ncbi:MAG: hypothetical protein ABII27_08170 [bacterium]
MRINGRIVAVCELCADKLSELQRLFAEAVNINAKKKVIKNTSNSFTDSAL